MSAISVPFTFVAGTTIASAQVNANFSAIAAALQGIDNTNVGALGFYASQIIPLNGAQATFGGGQGYAFPTIVTAPQGFFCGPSAGPTFLEPGELQVQGPLFGIRGGGVQIAPVPPLYISGGVGDAQSAHLVRGKVAISIPSGATSTIINIPLAGDAKFTQEPTVTTGYISVPFVPGWTGGPGLGVMQPSVPFNTLSLVAYSQSGTAAVSTSTIVNAYYIAAGA